MTLRDGSYKVGDRVTPNPAYSFDTWHGTIEAIAEDDDYPIRVNHDDGTWGKYATWEVQHDAP